MMTPWAVCEDCGDMVCLIHLEHVADCPCPAVDEWQSAGYWPYASVITPELLEWVGEHALTN